MNRVSPYHRILFQHEALRSRLEIREYLLQTVAHEVYENIGQSLSLVRIYLVNLESSDSNIKKASHIVGQSIKDLKNLCRFFYRDIEAENTTGWINLLDYTIRTLSGTPCDPIIIEGEPIAIKTGFKLIVARLVQEILIGINEQGMTFAGARVNFSSAGIRISVDFSGRPFRFKDINISSVLDISPNCLNFSERAHLISAGVSRRRVNKGQRRIIIKVSLTSPFNE